MTEKRPQSTSGKVFNRRSFLGYGALATASALVPGRAHAAASAARRRERVLSFFHTHTGERLKIAYCCDGVYQPEALAQLNHLLRDFRVNDEKPIDPQLYDLLHELGGTLDTDSPFHVISGYRSPMTNAMLRERGGSHTGVASKSLHMVGKAIDIRVPGVKLDDLRAAAKSLQLGGVGFYPSSNFVHVDIAGLVTVFGLGVKMSARPANRLVARNRYRRCAPSPEFSLRFGR